MAYLRDMVEDCGVRGVPTTKCKGCRRVLYKFEKFCPFCGVENKRFDPAVWLKHALEPFETYECSRGLTHGTEAIGAMSLGFRHPRMPRAKFCTLCGAELPELPTEASKLSKKPAPVEKHITTQVLSEQELEEFLPKKKRRQNSTKN